MVGILLVQDIFIFPMLIIVGFLTNKMIDWNTVSLQIIGGIAMITLITWIVIKKKIDISFLKRLGSDHETQLFLSLILCFGIATLAGLLKISPALGAFLGGMLVAAIKETHWVHDNLLPLRTIFIAFFFISIGMLIKPDFIRPYFWQILLLTVSILVTNTLINAIVLKTLGESWRVSFYGGSLLSQIGELSFILTAIGYQTSIFSVVIYNMMNTTIAISFLLSPLWILLTKKIIAKAELHLATISQEKK
ncbi:Iron transporter MagA (plasmid) [Aquicella lusitana]|uniref:Sodium/hydrogen exchanger family protein n=1 Tax=Aquicella lusitana TaxID=254246 RepID=A0A370G1F4_9COXI|nr:cation:proton antiporter [Aquicella lusitana]RDI37572.1 sodium/hydrogen exchanger family protein [Aquicella lusitana]VVC74698.1 Iron transporter MagA [Aquicella lusitana]